MLYYGRRDGGDWPSEVVREGSLRCETSFSEPLLNLCRWHASQSRTFRSDWQFLTAARSGQSSIQCNGVSCSPVVGIACLQRRLYKTLFGRKWSAAGSDTASSCRWVPAKLIRPGENQVPICVTVFGRHCEAKPSLLFDSTGGAPESLIKSARIMSCRDRCPLRELSR